MKLRTLQIVRAIAANAVVLDHFRLADIKYGVGYQWLTPTNGLLGFLGVNCFFVISGVVISFLAKETAAPKFLYNRATRIYPIYWFYTALVLVAMALLPGAVNAQLTPSPSVWKSFLLWPNDALPLLVQGRTLINEMYFYFVVAAILFAGGRMLPTLLAWLALPLLFSEIPAGSPLLLLIVSPYTVLFIIGALTGLLIQSGCRRFAGPALIAGLVLIAVGIFAFVHFDCYGRSDWYSVVLLGLPFVPFLYALAILEPRVPTPNLLVKLGDASYSTYLSHTFVVSGLGRLFQTLHLQGWSAEAAYLIIAVASANIVGLLSYRLLEQPLLKVTRTRRSQSANLTAGARS